MPERRGRKRRTRDRRPRGDASAMPVAESPAPAYSQRPAAAVPSATARLTGLAIGAVTVFLAITLITGALSNDRSAADAGVRLGVGVFLVLLGIVVGVLSLFPAQLRRMIRGA